MNLHGRQENQQGREFYNILMEIWLDDNDILMQLT